MHGGLRAGTNAGKPRAGVVDAHLLAPATGLDPSDLTGLSNLEAFVQLAWQSPFSVQLDPPAPVCALPPYVPPSALSPAPRGEPAAVVEDDEQPDEQVPSYRAVLARRGLPDEIFEAALDEGDK